MLIILGLGRPSKIGFGVAEAIFPILLGTAAAASQVETRLLWSARALGTPESRLLWRVVLPAALGGMMTGARIALVGALIGVFLGEMIAGADGLGHMMAVSYRTLHTADMYVAVVTVSLIGLCLDRTVPVRPLAPVGLERGERAGNRALRPPFSPARRS